jgi:hypothetical protein
VTIWCHRCHGEAVEPIDLLGTDLWVCHEHLLAEDRGVIEFAAVKELEELEASYAASLERVRGLLADLRERRRGAALARRGSSGWGE